MHIFICTPAYRNKRNGGIYDNGSISFHYYSQMTTSKPKVLVVGSGGVGTMAALALTTRDRSEVTSVIRSDYDIITSKGYSISSCTYGEIEGWRPHNVAKSVADARQYGPFDYILLTTKNIPDGNHTCEDIIRPAVTDESVIILIQNGIGMELAMFEQFPDNIILSGVSFIGSTNYNGKVVNTGKDHLHIGDFEEHDDTDEERKSRSQAAINRFVDLYQNDNDLNIVEVDHNVKKSRWSKLVFNSVFNTITTLVNMDVNSCQILGANDTLFSPAIDELYAIARSDGVEIDPLVKHKFTHIGDGLFYAPSMCVDMRKKQLMELETILGNPLKVAAANGVPTPILSVVYSLLHLVQFRIKQESGMIKIDQTDFKGNSDGYPKIYEEKYLHKSTKDE